MTRPPAPPLFLVGMPRSGTKLLRELLNGHPEIAIPQVETEFLPLWVREWPGYGDLSDRGCFGNFYRRVCQLPFFVYLAERGETVDEDRWYAACASFDCAGVFQGLIRTVVGDAAPIWGDKSPSYVRHVPMLRQLFPEARVVHIVRDVRDHAVSIRRAWGKSLYRAAQRWAEDVQRGLDDVAALGPQGLVVRYEALIAEPVTTLGRLCDFIGVAFHEDMTTLATPAENLGRARGARRILPHNTATWRGVVDGRRQRRIEEIAFDTMTRLGYRPELARGAKPLGAPARLMLKGADGWAVVRSAARQRGWLGAARFHYQFHRYKAAGRTG